MVGPPPWLHWAELHRTPAQALQQGMVGPWSVLKVMEAINEVLPAASYTWRHPRVTPRVLAPSLIPGNPAEPSAAPSPAQPHAHPGKEGLHTHAKRGEINGRN